MIHPPISSVSLSTYCRLLVVMLLLCLSQQLLVHLVSVRSTKPVSLYPNLKQHLRQVQDHEVGRNASLGGVPDSRTDPYTQTPRKEITTSDIKLQRAHESTDAGDQSNTTSVTQDVPGRKDTKHTVGGKKNTMKDARQIPEDKEKTLAHRDQLVSPGQQITSY